MGTPPTKKQNVKRLAKGLSKDKANEGRIDEGKGANRTRAGEQSRGTTSDARPISPLVRLIQSLRAEKIGFQIVGMTAAALQGVIMATLDTDIWVDLPERQYVRLMNLCIKQGGTAIAPTLYALSDGKLVNFLFQVHGLGSFKSEYKKATDATLEGEPIKVLRLQSILKSKKTIKRDKDLNHILMIEKFLRGKKLAGRMKK